MSNRSEANAVAEAMITLWEGELPATVRVLFAVPDANRDYRPAPKSRSAWELAKHIATADAWFIDSISRGVFEFNPEAAKQAEAQFRNVADVVAYYQTTIPEKLRRLRALLNEQLAEE